MTADRLRGQRRAEVAQRLAHRFHSDRSIVTVTALAVGIGLKPSTVRRLLSEAGVRSRRLLVGLADDEVTAELVRRFRRDASVWQLRGVTGLDERVIRDRLRLAGVTLAKRTSRSDFAVSVPKLVELYEAGASLSELTALSGGSYGTVRRVLLAAGVQLRSRGGR